MGDDIKNSIKRADKATSAGVYNTSNAKEENSNSAATVKCLHCDNRVYPICKTCLEDQGLPVAVPCKVSQHKINEVAHSTSDNTDIPKCLCGECKIPCIHNDK